MYHQVIIKKDELAKVISHGPNLAVHLWSMPAKSTLHKAAIDEKTGDLVVEYETPDETPFTISTGESDGMCTHVD